MATQDTSKQSRAGEIASAPIEAQPLEAQPVQAQPVQAQPLEQSEPEAERAPSQGILERAKTGRARCRACSEPLIKGQLRCGEQLPNPFGEGTTSYWFHPRCAAERRPEAFLNACQTSQQEAQSLGAELEELSVLAEFGASHPRASRIASLGVAPSGRARCRSCRELIEKGAVRAELSIFQEGRFDPMGYLHVTCVEPYVGARMPWAHLEHKCDSLSSEQRDAVREICM